MFGITISTVIATGDVDTERGSSCYDKVQLMPMVSPGVPPRYSVTWFCVKECVSDTKVVV